MTFQQCAIPQNINESLKGHLDQHKKKMGTDLIQLTGEDGNALEFKAFKNDEMIFEH